MADSNVAHVDFDWDEIFKVDTPRSTVWIYEQGQRLEIVNMSDDGKSVTTTLDERQAYTLYQSLKRKFDAQNA